MPLTTSVLPSVMSPKQHSIHTMVTSNILSCPLALPVLPARSKPISTTSSVNTLTASPLPIWTTSSSTRTLSKNIFSMSVPSSRNSLMPGYTSNSRNANSTPRKSVSSDSSSPLKASLWIPNALIPLPNGLFPNPSSTSKSSWDSPTSTVASSKDTLVSSSRSPAYCVKVNVLSGPPKPKLPSISSSPCSRLHLFFVISTLNSLSRSMQIHLDSLCLVSYPSPMLTVSCTPSPFGPESVSLQNATTISTIAKCSPLSNASNIGVTTSKVQNTLSTSVPITRTSKPSCPRKS